MPFTCRFNGLIVLSTGALLIAKSKIGRPGTVLTIVLLGPHGLFHRDRRAANKVTSTHKGLRTTRAKGLSETAAATATNRARHRAASARGPGSARAWSAQARTHPRPGTPPGAGPSPAGSYVPGRRHGGCPCSPRRPARRAP